MRSQKIFFIGCALALSFFLFLSHAFPNDSLNREKTVTISFHDANIHDVLLMLSEASNTNMVIVGDISDRITLRLVEVPVRQAIEIIFGLAGIHGHIMGDAVIVEKNR